MFYTAADLNVGFACLFRPAARSQTEYKTV